MLAVPEAWDCRSGRGLDPSSCHQQAVAACEIAPDAWHSGQARVVASWLEACMTGEMEAAVTWQPGMRYTRTSYRSSKEVERKQLRRRAYVMPKCYSASKFRALSPLSGKRRIKGFICLG